MKTIGDHIRKKRLDLSLLQNEVARQLGVDTDSVTNWENNRSSPKLSLFPKVAKFLGYAPDLSSTKGIGEKVRALRRLMGTRQEDLARLLGVDPSTLARWERGAGQPSARHRARLAEFLNSIDLTPS